MQDKKELEKYIKGFVMKAPQVIVQSRIGEKITSVTNSSNWVRNTKVTVHLFSFKGFLRSTYPWDTVERQKFHKETPTSLDSSSIEARSVVVCGPRCFHSFIIGYATTDDGLEFRLKEKEITMVKGHTAYCI